MVYGMMEVIGFSLERFKFEFYFHILGCLVKSFDLLDSSAYLLKLG